MWREIQGDTAHCQAPNNIVPAKPDYGRDGDGRQNFHHRIVDSVGHDRVLERFHVEGIYFRKFVIGALLAVKKLQHDHAAYMLLHVGINASNRSTNAAVGITDLVAKNLSSDRDQRKYRERNERQFPVHAEHDAGDTGEHKNVFKNRHHAGGEHFVQCVHI